MTERRHQKAKQQVDGIISELKGLRKAMKSSKSVNKELSNLDFQYSVIRDLSKSGKLPFIKIPHGNVNVSDLGQEKNSA